MKVYDYGKIKNCFICGNIDGNFDRFIKNVVNSVDKTSSYQVEIHPKEIERQERLKRKGEENNERVMPIGGRPYAAPIKTRLKHRNSGHNLTNSVVIVDGSNSFGERDLKFYYDKFEMLNKVLADNNTHILFVRGYDDPKYFEEELLNLSNIKTIQDYSVIKLNKFNCLCIGGGVSIDRSWKIGQEQRLGRKMYWEGEALQYRENDLNEIFKKYNIACIVTTSSPSFAYPGMNHVKLSSWASNDKHLVKDVTNERMIMDKIYNKIVETNKKPYIWVYSKFKNSNHNMINDILFDSLSSFQFFDFNNTAISVFNVNFSKMLKENEFSSDNIPNHCNAATFDVYEDNEDMVEGLEDLEEGNNEEDIDGEYAEEPIPIGNIVETNDAPIAIDNRDFEWHVADWRNRLNDNNITVNTQQIFDRLNEALIGIPNERTIVNE